MRTLFEDTFEFCLCRRDKSTRDNQDRHCVNRKSCTKNH